MRSVPVSALKVRRRSAVKLMWHRWMRLHYWRGKSKLREGQGGRSKAGLAKASSRDSCHR
jgi:hypothetical protein